MIKFLILCIIFLSLYFGFTLVTHFDSALELTLFDYQIETTSFTFLAIFIITQLLLAIILKTLFWFFDMPRFLKDKWQKKKMTRVNQKLLYAFAKLLMGNRQEAISLTNQLISDIDHKNQEIISLILAEAEIGIDKKIQYLSQLTDKKYYSLYASKNLAELFYNNDDYKMAEKYAVKAFNEDDTDAQLMLVLARIYASVGSWNKMLFVITKLQKSDDKLFVIHAKEIAKFYYEAAKSYIQSDSDEEALRYLENALEIYPSYIEALSLFVEISNNMKNTASTLKMLKSVFALEPCFEIALMYINNSHSSEGAIYGTLASIVSPSKYPELFISIAAYLKLFDNVEEIRNSIQKR